MVVANEPADEELIARYLRGDMGAFDRLYRRHDRKTFAFIRQMLHPTDRATVEDLHQEGWLAVASKAASFTPAKAKFSTWLYTVLRNRVVDHLRARPPQGDDEADPDLLASSANGPEQQLVSKRLVQAVEGGLLRLSVEQREAFLLFTVVELSLAEIADVTQAHPETAKTRLRYAREALRHRLSEWRDG
ncbi:sigma-70 family RNA polymerase sigma factor [Roseateles sp. NT4]|uniref:sigma-70 family RNA polymerase sigma factor n=1 Tax=Roseateles sp. NT4 TaxID=3453715 RepID=UPI003EEE3041